MRIKQHTSLSMRIPTRWKWLACVVLAVGATGAYGQASRPRSGPYQVVASVPGGGADSLWDYATIDAPARRLYLAQAGVTVLDLDTGKVTPHFIAGKKFEGLAISHKVVPLNDDKALAVSVAGTNSVDFFDPQTGTLLSELQLGPVVAGKFHSPDWLLFEPTSRLLIAVDGDSSSLSLIDTKTFAKAGEIPIGKGKLETAVADGGGLVYVNEEEAGRIAVVNVEDRKVIKEIAMKHCKEPTGLAYDSKDRMVMSVCSNGSVKFIGTDTGREVASVKVGADSDALVYDPERHFVFSFCGTDGTLSIVAVRDRQNIELVQTLKTKPSARLGALDPKTGRLYIPAAKMGPPAAPISLPGMKERPGLNPGTFEFIVIAPSS